MSLRERLEIPLSKKKLMMALIGSVGFAVGGVFMLLNPALVDDPILATPGLTFFTGLVSVPIFGMIASIYPESSWIKRQGFSSTPSA